MHWCGYSLRDIWYTTIARPCVLLGLDFCSVQASPLLIFVRYSSARAGGNHFQVLLVIALHLGRTICPALLGDIWHTVLRVSVYFGDREFAVFEHRCICSVHDGAVLSE